MIIVDDDECSRSSVDAPKWRCIPMSWFVLSLSWEDLCCVMCFVVRGGADLRCFVTF